MTSRDPLQRGLRPPLLHRVTTQQLQAIDYVIAGLLIVVALLGFRAGSAHQHAGNTVQVFILCAAAVGIILRRRFPMTALAVLTVATGVAIIVNRAASADVFIAFPMYQVASNYERRRSLPALAVVCLVVVLPNLSFLLSNSRGDVNLTEVLVAVAAWFVGDSVRVRRTYVAGLAEQATQRQREILERAQRSVAEERLQIARDLHDVVAHSLSVIAVQSGVGRHVIDEHPAQAKIALAAVEETSRTALVELRRMLGVLRHDDQQPASLTPAPGVSSLGPLVEQVRAAGVEVVVDLHSSLTSELSPTTNLAIYRIVQEALTNVVKHVGSGSVVVELRDEPDALVLEVVDDGGGGLPAYPKSVEEDGAHHGIVGMRERVALFEGSLVAAARPGGGFGVLARFPLSHLGLP